MNWRKKAVDWLLSSTLAALSLTAGYFLGMFWGVVTFFALVAGYTVYILKQSSTPVDTRPQYQEQRAVARSSRDIAWNDEGISYVCRNGKRTLKWYWRDIAATEDISLDYDDGPADGALNLRLDFRTNLSAAELSARDIPSGRFVWLAFGKKQQPGTVLRQLREGWLEWRAKESPNYSLNAQAKALRLAELFAEPSVLEALKLALSNSPKFIELYKAVDDLCRQASALTDAELANVAASPAAKKLGVRLEGLSSGSADVRFEPAELLKMPIAERSVWALEFALGKAGLTGRCDWKVGPEDILWHFEFVLRAFGLEPITKPELELLWSSEQAAGMDDWYMPDLLPALAEIAAARKKSFVLLNTYSDEYVFTLLPLGQAACWDRQELGNRQVRLEFQEAV